VTGPRRILRYDFGERVVHTLAAISYVYLLLTGLAFWTPWLFWIAIVLGGGFVSRMLHPWIGLIFALAVSAMYVRWRREMRTAPEDRAWRQAMMHYVRNEDGQVPPAGRFNYGQKTLFWVMAIGGLALLLSGLVMWVVASIPPGLQFLRPAITFVHAAAALVTIGGFIVHVYMGVAVVPGGLSAIVHGEVSEQWARHHHAAWYREVERSKLKVGR
jgi:formate dehydrogenase subunit gamma